MLVPYVWSQATDQELWGFTNYVEAFFVQFGVSPDEIIESEFFSGSVINFLKFLDEDEEPATQKESFDIDREFPFLDKFENDKLIRKSDQKLQNYL